MNKKLTALTGIAAIGVLAFFLLKGRQQPTTVVNREFQTPSFSLPPLDLSGLGVFGNTPIQWPTGSGINVPPIVMGGSGNKKCCSACEDTGISSWQQNIVDALSIGPPQPYVNMEMLTPTERAAVQMGQAQVVYDPGSPRGFFVAVLPSDIPYAAQGPGIIYQGAMPVLPANVGGDIV
jgi:hypothetical protein